MSPYQYGESNQKEQAIARSIRAARQRRARLTKKLEGVNNEVQALRRSRDIVKDAEKQAISLCEQAIREAESLKSAARAEAYATVESAQSEAERIVQQAHQEAGAVREQAYDFGLAQLDRDYPTRQDRTRERERAKRTLVKHYAKQRLLAAAHESAEWDKSKAMAA